MNEFDDKPWLADAKALLDESAGALDAPTLSRLNRARHAALAQRGPRWPGIGWLPATAVAGTCALLLGVAVWTTQRAPTRGAPVAASAAPAAAAAALGDDDSLEFYQDLEFYAWLDAEQDGDGDG